MWERRRGWYGTSSASPGPSSPGRDRAAIQVADYHIPGIRHRGDITEDTPEDVAAEVRHIDAQAECMILFTAAPPCQDFSRVGDRDGHAGNRGFLFNFTAEFLDELRRRLAPRRFGFLVENVEMTPADAAEASKQLGCQPIFADAADFGWIGRPRLWWTSIDWDEVTHDPSTAERWTWVLHRRWDRLRLDSPRAAPDSFDLDGLKFSDAVASGRIRLPCSTAPAADERGRPLPRSMRGKVTTDVQQRWLQDSRQFAPWHYQREAMLADDQGKLVVLTPGAKEQLHHMPKNFTARTAQGDLEPRTRHRLLGNGWHWGVARRLLLALLVHTAVSVPPVADDATDVHNPVGRRTLGAGRPADGTSAGQAVSGAPPRTRRGGALAGILGPPTPVGDATAD